MRLDRFRPAVAGSAYDPMTHQMASEGYASGIDANGALANPDYDIFYDQGAFIIFRTDPKTQAKYGMIFERSGSGFVSGPVAKALWEKYDKQFPRAREKDAGSQTPPRK